MLDLRWRDGLKPLISTHNAGLTRLGTLCRPPPEAHRPALDLRGRDDLEQLVKDTGREYRTYKYYAKMAPEPFDVRHTSAKSGNCCPLL